MLGSELSSGIYDQNCQSIQYDNQMSNMNYGIKMKNMHQITDATRDIISGCQSTIENKNNNGLTLTDELIKDFEEFNDVNQNDQESQYFQDEEGFEQNKNFNRSNYIQHLDQFQEYQNQSIKSHYSKKSQQQQNQFKDIVRDISPRNDEQNYIQQQDSRVNQDLYYEQNGSQQYEIQSQQKYFAKDKRLSSLDRFSQYIDQNQNHNNSSLSNYQNSIMNLENNNCINPSQQRNENQEVYRQSNQFNNLNSRFDDDSRYYEQQQQFGFENQQLNSQQELDNPFNDKFEIYPNREKSNHQQSIDYNNDPNSSKSINNRNYSQISQKIKNPPYSEQHGRAKLKNQIKSEYGTACPNPSQAQCIFLKDQTDNYTQNTQSAKFNDLNIGQEEQQISSKNQYPEINSQQTDIFYPSKHNNNKIYLQDQIDSKYLKNIISLGSDQFQFQQQQENDSLEINQTSGDFEQNLIYVNKGTDPKTITDSSQSGQKQNKSHLYQQLIKSQYEDISKDDESHFFSITDIQYQDGSQPVSIKNATKQISSYERNRHQQLDVLYYSLNQNSDKSNNFDGQIKNVNQFNPYYLQNSSVNNTYNQGYLNQTSSTEQDYINKNIQNQYNMNLKSDFGKKLMNQKRNASQFSPFKQFYQQNQNEQLSKISEEQENKYIQPPQNIFSNQDQQIQKQKQQSQNTVITYRTKSSHGNKNEVIQSSQNTFINNMVTYRDKPSESYKQKEQFQPSVYTSPNYLINSNINTQRVDNFQIDHERSSSVENQSQLRYNQYLHSRNNNKQNSFQLSTSQQNNDVPTYKIQKADERKNHSINAIQKQSNTDTQEIYFNTSHSPSQITNCVLKNYNNKNSINKEINIKSNDKYQNHNDKFNHQSELYEDTFKDPLQQDNLIKLQKIQNNYPCENENHKQLMPVQSRKELMLKLFKKNQDNNIQYQNNQNLIKNSEQNKQQNQTSILCQQIQYLNQKYRTPMDEFKNQKTNPQKNEVKAVQKIYHNQRSSSEDQCANRGNYNQQIQIYNQNTKIGLRDSRNFYNFELEQQTGQFNHENTFKFDQQQEIEGLGIGIQNQLTSNDSRKIQRSSKVDRLKQFQIQRNSKDFNETNNVERLKIIQNNKLFLNQAKFDLTLFQKDQKQSTNKFKFESIQDSNYANNNGQIQTLDSHKNSNFTLGDRNFIYKQQDNQFQKLISPHSTIQTDKRIKKINEAYQDIQYNKQHILKENIKYLNNQKEMETQNLQEYNYKNKVELVRNLQNEFYQPNQNKIEEAKTNLFIRPQYVNKNEKENFNQNFINSQSKQNQYMNEILNTDRQYYQQNENKNKIDYQQLENKRHSYIKQEIQNQPLSNFHKSFLNKQHQTINKNSHSYDRNTQQINTSSQNEQRNIPQFKKNIINRNSQCMSVNQTYENIHDTNLNKQKIQYVNQIQIKNDNKYFENDLHRCKSLQNIQINQCQFDEEIEIDKTNEVLKRLIILKERQKYIQEQAKHLSAHNYQVINKNIKQQINDQQVKNCNQYQRSIGSHSIEVKRSSFDKVLEKENFNKQVNNLTIQERNNSLVAIAGMQLKSSFGQNFFKQATRDPQYQFDKIKDISQVKQEIKLNKINKAQSILPIQGLQIKQEDVLDSPVYQKKIMFQNIDKKFDDNEIMEELRIQTLSYEKKNEQLRKKYLDFNIIQGKPLSNIQTLEKNDENINANEQEDMNIYAITKRSNSNYSQFIQNQNNHKSNPFSYIQSYDSTTNKLSKNNELIQQNLNPLVLNFLSLLFGQNYFFKAIQSNIQMQQNQIDIKNQDQRNGKQSEQNMSEDTYFNERCMTPKLSEYAQEEEYEIQKMQLYEQLYNNCQNKQTSENCSEYENNYIDQNFHENFMNQQQNHFSLNQINQEKYNEIVQEQMQIIKEAEVQSQSLNQLTDETNEQNNSYQNFQEKNEIPTQGLQNLLKFENNNLEKMWELIHPNSSGKNLKDLIKFQYEQAQMLIDLQTQFLQVQQIEEAYKLNDVNSSIISRKKQFSSIKSFKNTKQHKKSIQEHMGSVNNCIITENSIDIQNTIQNYQDMQKQKCFKTSGIQNDINQQIYLNQSSSDRNKQSSNSKQERKSRKQNTEVHSKKESISSKIKISQESIPSKKSKNQLSVVSNQKQSTYDLIKKIYKQMEKIDSKIQQKEKIDEEQMNKMWRVIRKFQKIFKRLKKQNKVICVQAQKEFTNSINSEDNSIQEQSSIYDPYENINECDFQKQQRSKKCSKIQTIKNSAEKIQINYDVIDEQYQQENQSEKNNIEIYRVAHIKKILYDDEQLELKTQLVDFKDQQLSAQNESSFENSQSIPITKRQFNNINDFNQQFPSLSETHSQRRSEKNIVQCNLKESSRRYKNIIASNNPQQQMEQALQMDQSSLSHIILNPSSCYTNLNQNQYFQQLSYEDFLQQQQNLIISQKSTEKNELDLKIEINQRNDKQNNFKTQQQQFIRDIDYPQNNKINQSSGTATQTSKDSLYFQKQSFVELIQNNQQQMIVNIQTANNAMIVNKQFQNEQQISSNQTLTDSQLQSKRIQQNHSNTQFEKEQSNTEKESFNSYDNINQKQKSLKSKENVSRNDSIINSKNEQFDEKIIEQKFIQITDESQNYNDQNLIKDSLENIEQQNREVNQNGFNNQEENDYSRESLSNEQQKGHHNQLSDIRYSKHVNTNAGLSNISTSQNEILKEKSISLQSNQSLVDTEKYRETVRQLNKAVFQKQKLVEKLQRIKDKIKKAKNIKHIYKLQTKQNQIENSLVQEQNFILQNFDQNQQTFNQQQDLDQKIETYQQQIQDESLKIEDVEKQQQYKNENIFKCNNSFVDFSNSQLDQLCQKNNLDDQIRSKSLNNNNENLNKEPIILNIKQEQKLNFDLYKQNYNYQNIFNNKKIIDDKQNLSNDYSLYTYSQQKIMQDSRRGIFQKIVDLQKLRNQKDNFQKVEQQESANKIPIIGQTSSLNNIQSTLMQNNNSFQSSFNNTIVLKDYEFLNSQKKNLIDQYKFQGTDYKNELQKMNSQNMNRSMEKSFEKIGSGLSGQIYAKQQTQQVEFTPSQSSNFKGFTNEQIVQLQLSSKFAKQMLQDQKSPFNHNQRDNQFPIKKLNFQNDNQASLNLEDYKYNQKILVIDQKDKFNQRDHSQDVNERDSFSRNLHQDFIDNQQYNKSAQNFKQINSQNINTLEKRNGIQFQNNLQLPSNIKLKQQPASQLTNYDREKGINSNVKVLDSQPYSNKSKMYIKEYEMKQEKQVKNQDKQGGRSQNKKLQGNKIKSESNSYTNNSQTIQDNSSNNGDLIHSRYGSTIQNSFAKK